MNSQLTKAKLVPVFVIPLIGISVPLILMIVVTGYKHCKNPHLLQSLKLSDALARACSRTRLVVVNSAIKASRIRRG